MWLKQCMLHSFDMVMFVLVLLLLHHPLEGDASQISCYDDLGNSVDWFYLYKLPHQHGKSRVEGLKYLLMDRGSEVWMEGKGPVNDSTGALGRTVGLLYEGDEVGYILYNDQPPTSEGERAGDGDAGRNGGHTKGVVLFDKQQGFWLVHSTPHFPPPQKEGPFSYPSTGVVNGQNFICVTYPLERFQTIGEQLQINQPRIYDCHIPASLASAVPSMAQLCKQSRREGANGSLLLSSSPSSNRSVALTSLAGTEFISFAKGASFGDDLYHSWVAPTLQTDLLVQFWRRSSGILPSDCSRSWKVLDVALISPGQSFTFSATQDHSKWAVSTTGGGGRGGRAGTGGWVCVGDINRNKAEERRGGGTVCRRDAAVWKAYRTAALKCDSCKGGVDVCDSAVRELELFN